MSSKFDQLLARARALERRPHELRSGRPSLGLAIVTCMDARIDVFAALTLRDGEAHVIRNAGAVVTEDVIRSLALSQVFLGTDQVAVVGHTDCAMLTLDNAHAEAELARAAGVVPPFTIGAFNHLETQLRDSVRQIRTSPFLRRTVSVRAFVYDLATGDLTEVSTELNHVNDARLSE